MSLYPHTVRPARGSKHTRKIVGRGNASGHGNQSGRGGKGQTARSGGSRGLQKKGFKFLLQSTPKLRGFTSLMEKPVTVYLSDLEKHYQNGETVTVATLKQKNVIKESAAAAKIVSTGDLTKKVVVEGVAASASAAEKIKAAGGEVK